MKLIDKMRLLTLMTSPFVLATGICLVRMDYGIGWFSVALGGFGLIIVALHTALQLLGIMS